MKYSFFHNDSFLPQRFCFMAVEGPNYETNVSQSEKKELKESQAPAAPEKTLETKQVDSAQLEKALSRSDRPLLDLKNNPENQTSQKIVLKMLESSSDIEEYSLRHLELKEPLEKNRTTLLKGLSELGLAA